MKARGGGGAPSYTPRPPRPAACQSRASSAGQPGTLHAHGTYLCPRPLRFRNASGERKHGANTEPPLSGSELLGFSTGSDRGDDRIPQRAFVFFFFFSIATRVDLRVLYESRTGNPVTSAELSVTNRPFGSVKP